jgi:phosphoribosylamine-glycine ligase
MFREDYAVAVRMSLPPYPIIPKEGLPRYKGVRVLDIENGARNHVFLADVMLKDEVECLAGVDGVIGCVTARGETIQEVRRRAYRTLDRIVIHEDVQFRKDVGAGVEDRIGRLKEWGWLA